MQQIIVYLSWVIAQLIVQVYGRLNLKRRHSPFMVPEQVSMLSRASILGWLAALVTTLYAGLYVDSSETPVQFAIAVLSMGFAIATFIGVKEGLVVKVLQVIQFLVLMTLAVFAALNGFGLTDLDFREALHKLF